MIKKGTQIRSRFKWIDVGEKITKFFFELKYNKAQDIDWLIVKYYGILWTHLKEELTKSQKS